jgi:hypothetical protein
LDGGRDVNLLWKQGDGGKIIRARASAEKNQVVEYSLAGGRRRSFEGVKEVGADMQI